MGYGLQNPAFSVTAISIFESMKKYINLEH
jgi:hypothetical protein